MTTATRRPSPAAPLSLPDWNADPAIGEARAQRDKRRADTPTVQARHAWASKVLDQAKRDYERVRLNGVISKATPQQVEASRKAVDDAERDFAEALALLEAHAEALDFIERRLPELEQQARRDAAALAVPAYLAEVEAFIKATEVVFATQARISTRVEYLAAEFTEYVYGDNAGLSNKGSGFDVNLLEVGALCLNIKRLNQKEALAALKTKARQHGCKV